MSVPVLSDDDSPVPIRIRALPDYEPDDSHVLGELPLRWSSLRPAAGPQLALAEPPRPAEPPVPPETLWRLVATVLEVLDGRRQVGQLRTLLPDIAYEALLTRLRATAPGSRHVLRRLRACYPAPKAIEVAAVVEVVTAAHARGRGRMFALAARFEHRKATWRCTVLRIL